MFLHLAHLAASHALAFLGLALGTAAVDPGTAGGDPGADPGAGGDPGAGKPGSIADVGRRFLEGLTPEQRTAEFTDLDDDDAGDGIDDIDAAPEGAVPDPITREDGATWNVEAGRWQMPTGAFVAGAAPDGATPKPGTTPAKPAAAAPAPDPAAKPADERAWTKIALPGLTDRGEQELEIEIDDPQIVERLNRLKSEAGRARALQKKQGDVDAQAAELAELDAYLEHDPVGFMVSRVKPELREQVARALLLEHFDALVPLIAEFQADPTARAETRLALRDEMDKTRGQMAQATQMRQHAIACVRAAEAMIPESADDDSAQAFLADARADLARLANAGQQVTPQTVPQLLARRASLYGFTQTSRGTGDAAPAAGATPPARSAPAAAPVARPVSDRARDIASRQPTREEAAQRQARIRQVQTQRAAAGRVAPAGAGAAPVQTPVLPPEAKTDIKSASRYLRRNGKLPETWAPTT